MRSLVIGLVVLLSGCAESRHAQCARIRPIVSEEMKAEAEFGKNAPAASAYIAYAAALKKANDGVRAVDVKDSALSAALRTYEESASDLAAAYELQAIGDAGKPEAASSSAVAGMIYGPMLAQSRVAIANACPD